MGDASAEDDCLLAVAFDDTRDPAIAGPDEDSAINLAKRESVIFPRNFFGKLFEHLFVEVAIGKKMIFHFWKPTASDCFLERNIDHLLSE